MSYQLISGFYGSENTPCNIHVFNTLAGCWYCVDGSLNVNRSYQILEDGTDVEQVEDCDTFTWSQPITSEQEFTTAIEF